MTKARDLANIITGGFTEADIPNLPASKITSGTFANARLSSGISDTNVLVANANVADNDFLRIDGTSVEGRTAGETLTDIGASPTAGSSSIVTTGALDAGSITSGFGSIDTGSSTITTTGAITGGSHVADNITIDGTEIDLSSGDLTLDVAGDIIPDADGGDVKINDAGTARMHIITSASETAFFNQTSDSDIKFKGDDGGSTITALTLDMSEAGAATFNNNVTAYSDERLKSNIETLDGGLSKILSMRGVTYTRDEKDNIGVIAQEVEKVLPQIVLTADDEMGTKSVDYSRITAVLIEAVKELTKRVEELENNASSK